MDIVFPSSPAESRLCTYFQYTVSGLRPLRGRKIARSVSGEPELGLSRLMGSEPRTHMAAAEPGVRAGGGRRGYLG